MSVFTPRVASFPPLRILLFLPLLSGGATVIGECYQVWLYLGAGDSNSGPPNEQWVLYPWAISSSPPPKHHFVWRIFDHLWGVLGPIPFQFQGIAMFFTWPFLLNKAVWRLLMWGSQNRCLLLLHWTVPGWWILRWLYYRGDGAMSSLFLFSFSWALSEADNNNQIAGTKDRHIHWSFTSFR